ncbi:MAG: DUF4129 domain-containing protein [Fimbriimonadaceae bacterium]|nr:DUF4129 domain-containing protein [Fimbriimonadaceae bacterium]
MRRARGEAIESQIGSTDYLLSGATGVLAAYSAGMGVSSPAIGYFFSLGIAAGTITSMVFQKPLSTGSFRFDGWLYAVLALVSAFFAPELNALLPDDGFARQLMVAGILCWMLLLGSFTMWSDSTLLFQAVPSIALFGLVGCWDTYSGSTFLFFLFLLCVATLFARAHRRTMLARAAESGFATLDIGARFSLSRASQQLRDGPWRWMAGPEWGLASAAAIVVVSLIGAPILRSSVQPFSGFVQIQVPQTRTILPASTAAAEQDSVRIGQGPNTLSEATVLYALLDRPRYLRTLTYDVYDGRGWSRRRNELDPSNFWRLGASRAEMVPTYAHNAIAQPREFRFRIEMVQPLDSLPVPGEVRYLLVDRSKFRPRSDGTVAIVDRNAREAQGVSIEPAEGGEPRSVPDALADDLIFAADTGGIDPSVRRFAETAIGTANTDWEKAQALKRAIEQRCRYNLASKAIPADQDPVATFLTETNEGYCDLFASSMVLLARSAGIPARYAIGYYPVSGKKDDAERFIVRQADYHAWAELFFSGYGWVVFDATEGAAQAEGAGRGDQVDNRPWYQKDWAVQLLNVTIVLALIGAGCLAFRIWGKKVLPAALHPREDVRRLYRRFAQTLRKETGVVRMLGQTPTEYLEGLRAKLGDRYAAAWELNEALVLALFGPREPTPETLAELRRDVQRYRSRKA